MASPSPVPEPYGALPLTFGQPGAFDGQVESFTAYVERVQIFFEANDVPARKRLSVFLSIIGGTAYSLLRNLLSPVPPKEKSLEAHYEPKPIVIAERFHFHRRSQLPGESVAKFIAELRRLSIHCNFGAYLDEALRDRFVCGLRSETTQKRLLAVPDLKLQDALDMATAMEAAATNSKALQQNEVDSSASIKRFSSSSQQSSRPAAMKPAKLCYRCGQGDHHHSKCPHKETICHYCHKKGHLARVCRSKAQQNPLPSQGGKPKSSTTRAHTVAASGDKECEDELHLYQVGKCGSASKSLTCTLQIENQSVAMEVDTGADVSIISEQTHQQLFPQLQLVPSHIRLTTYTNEVIPVKGQIPVHVRHGEQAFDLTLIVVAGSGPSLLGRNWLRRIRLDWRAIHNATSVPSPVSSLLSKHQCLFSDEPGTITTERATLLVKPDATPRFFKPRPVPYAIRDAVGAQLDKLESDGVLEKVSHSDWAAPIVVVPKQDGSYRLCGDYKVTVNQALEVEQYPLPRPEDLLATLAGGQKFTKLDLRQAYQQLRLDDQSKPFTTINTHKGLYRYTRLLYGIASAPAMFQKTMDTILQGIPQVCCYIDDILVTGKDDAEHLEHLQQVLERLERFGLHLKQSKCEFMRESVEYLGYKIDAQGVHTLPSKVQAIAHAPPPQDPQQLRSFLSLVNYYGKFIPNLATLVNPLNKLLHKDAPWKWDATCQAAFSSAQEALTSSPVLIHYDPTLPVCLATDASAYGVGAVIPHTLPDGTERPIAFASRTLSTSEVNYAQIEKEALSIVFGVKRFHTYLYGRRFTLLTDHKPLCTILGPKKGVPTLAAARLQRWAVLLSAYRYDIRYKSTREHANADCLSRLPLPLNTKEGDTPEASIFQIGQLDSLPVTHRQIQQATERDPVLSKVLTYTRQCWPLVVPDELKPYSNRREELTLEGNCVLWGMRVVVPDSLQGRVLGELHRTHAGMNQMKRVARSYMWWPQLDKHIEDLVKSCPSCQSNRESPPVAPLQPWPWPAKPWQRIHVDFAGPFLGKMFFLVVDAHSKWPEVFEMPSTTSNATIHRLRHLFASYGLPCQLVSDNGPQFCSEEFATFLKANGVRHIRCAPYHPASNGLVERFVRTFKQALKARASSGLPLQHCLASFLFGYRTTPHTTTGRSPSVLFLGRELRTRLDLLRPNCEDHVVSQQSNQVQHHDQHAKPQQFQVGQQVMVRNYRSGPQWCPAVVKSCLGPRTVLVETDQSQIWKRHHDQLRLANVATDPPSDQSDDVLVLDHPVAPETATETTDTSSIPPRYPQRNRQPPDRYGHPVHM